MKFILLFALAWANPLLESKIEDEINSFHPAADGAWWKGLGQDGSVTVLRMLKQSDVRLHRLRLIEGLGWIGDARAKDFLQKDCPRLELELERKTCVRALKFGEPSVRAKDAGKPIIRRFQH